MYCLEDGAEAYSLEIRGRKTRRTIAVHITDYGNKIKQKKSIGFPTDVFVFCILGYAEVCAP